MIENTIFSLPYIRGIYVRLTNGCYQFSHVSYKTQQQVKSIIKGLIVRGVFRYYHAPNIVYLALNTNAEARLLAYLNKLHQQRGEKLSDEEIKQEINQINTLIDHVVEELVTKESNND